MEIVYNKKIRTKFKNGKVNIYRNGRNYRSEPFNDGYSRSSEIKWLVVHGTAGGSTISWIEGISLKSRRGINYCKGVGLFHYYIRRDGLCTNVIDPMRWCHHASIGSLDMGTIGVEMENLSPGNYHGYTDAQYETLMNLYKYLRGELNLANMDIMLSHNRCKQKVQYEMKGHQAPKVTKNCPGGQFNWKRVAEDLNTAGYNCKRNPKFESIWSIERAEL